MISAKIIADSLNTHGQRLTTFVLVFPRIVLAEFNTHRMISRNSASSRAIPFEKMVERCKTDPFIPIRWMKDHSGMQGNEYFTEESEISWLKMNHLKARDQAVERAEDANERGLTKQMVNRYLEPYMWHTVIATATDWENFFSLRAHEAAEIHIQDLAYKMLEAYNKSIPNLLQPGEWHIPFGDSFDKDRLYTMIEAHYGVFDPIISYKESKGDYSEQQMVDKYKIMIATARCARISYNTFEGKDDYEADIKLHDRLATSGHWSPFEHCAKAMTKEEFHSHLFGKCDYTDGHIYFKDESSCGWCGNFRGFIQYRKLFNNENRTDDRVLTK